MKNSKKENSPIKELSLLNIQAATKIKKQVSEFCQSFIECSNIKVSGTVIECNLQIAKNYIADDAVCLFKIDEIEREDHGVICTGCRFYLWSGKLNVWIAFTYESAPLLELLDQDESEIAWDDLIGNLPQFDEEKASVDSLALAQMNGFGALRNRDQRADFAKKLLKSRPSENTPEYRRHIAAISETYFDFGILPIESKRLTNEGKASKEIAAMYGVTKSKIERSLLIDPVDFVVENYKKPQ